jgi:hypothetical protein
MIVRGRHFTTFDFLEKLESAMFESKLCFVWLTRRERKRREPGWTFKDVRSWADDRKKRSSGIGKRSSKGISDATNHVISDKFWDLSTNFRMSTSALGERWRSIQTIQLFCLRTSLLSISWGKVCNRIFGKSRTSCITEGFWIQILVFIIVSLINPETQWNGCFDSSGLGLYAWI